MSIITRFNKELSILTDESIYPLEIYAEYDSENTFGLRLTISKTITTGGRKELELVNVTKENLQELREFITSLENLID